MADTSLLGCPPEILDLIFEPLEKKDWLALCLVSRGARQRAEPFLYSKISWTWDFVWPGCGGHSNRPLNRKIPPIVQFLRNISARPELGPFARDVALKGDSLSRISHWFRGTPPALPLPDHDAHSSFIRMVSDVGMPEEDEVVWIQALRAGVAEGFVALLLAQAPNLRHLRLDENLLRDSRFIDRLLAWTVSGGDREGQRLFQQLTEAHLLLSSDMRYRADARHTPNTATCLSLFYLPSIERLSVSIDNPRGQFQWPLEQSPHAPRLTWLDLGMLRECHLGEVLSVTPNLETLRYGWFHHPMAPVDAMRGVVDLDRVAADLSRVCQTLTRLIITAEIELEPGREMASVQVKGSLAGLTSLEALTSLELPLPFLVGSFSRREAHDPDLCLPRNLETLTITDDLFLVEDWGWGPDDWRDFFVPWLVNAAWKASAPRLRRLRFLFFDHDDEALDPEATVALVELGKRMGLEVEAEFERPNPWECRLDVESIARFAD